MPGHARKTQQDYLIEEITKTMLTKSQELKLGSFLSYIQMALGIVIGLVYTPVMIHLLGQNEYGLYSTVSSTISMLGILNLGFSSSYVRYYSIYKVNNDLDGINKLNGMFLLVFGSIGFIAFVCGICLLQNMPLIFATGLTAEEYSTAEKLMVLLTINIALSFPFSVFSTIITANERFVFQKALYMIRTIIAPVLSIVVLMQGYHSVGMVAVTLALSVICDICYAIFVIKKLNNKFVFHDFEKGLFKDLFIFSSFLAINTIVDQINWNIDKILLARYVGTAEVAVYAIGFSLYGYYQGFSTSVSSIFTPRIHMIVNSVKDQASQRRELTGIFTKVGRIQFFILGLVLTGFFFFGETFIVDLWAGNEYENSYYVALLLMMPATIPLIQNLGIEVQRAQNRHQFRSIVYLCMAIINLILSVFLCQLYGSVGSAIGTAISLVVANGIAINIYYHKKCNIDVIVFWKNIIKGTKGFIIPIFAGVTMRSFMLKGTWLSFGICVLAYSMVYVGSVWKLSMNDYERGLILSVVRRIPILRRLLKTK